jgi:hypothetical protein
VSFYDEFTQRQMLTGLYQSHDAFVIWGKGRIDAIALTLEKIQGNLMSLTPAVQVLVDENVQIKSVVSAMKAKMDSVSSQVATLQAALAAVPAAGMSAEDLTAIQAVTADLAQTIADAQAAAEPAPAPAEEPAPEAPAEEPAPEAPAE